MSESDLTEQSQDVAGGVGAEPEELGYETPEADAAEQRREVREREPEEAPPEHDDVDPADALEQARVVELEEDEYP